MPAVFGMPASTFLAASCAECSVGFAALELRFRSDLGKPTLGRKISSHLIVSRRDLSNCRLASEKPHADRPANERKTPGRDCAGGQRELREAPGEY
jgi:hypothetical protein